MHMFSIINYKKFTVAAAMLALLLCHNAFALNDGKDQLRKDFEASFQEMLQHPEDVDIAMKYAKAAVGIGNYEAAIPPLERILMFNPDLPKIKLELGVLYYKLDSLKMAKSYFDGVIKSKNASKEMKMSAKEYLKKIKG